MAESQFYAILTDKGAALEAAALATGVPVTLNKFVIGDGGGNSVTPDPTRTSLVHEVYRGDIKSAEAQDNQVTFTLYVPPEAGGYTIREAGILASDGTLYSLSNSPDILKPTESNGAVISITFKYVLAVSSTSTVTVIIYDNYLTPEAADQKYLQIGKNLSEIKANGVNAQKAARDNIDVYSTEEVDNKIQNIDTQISDIDEKVDNLKPVLKVNETSPDANGNVDVGTVKSVNNSSPDAHGNVTISIPTFKETFTDVQLGAVASITDNEGDAIYDVPTGCVLTGLTDANDNVGNVRYKSFQKKINNSWLVISG
ncbi:phage tail protein [Citrobacter sp. S2-9]|uniref:Phage tail protein n=1 Tax=Citrobacter enshiensis TaxID=2971264 RepID=A0ABT8PSD7_9ENTR|nr:phage tail protein [Citrobacter enshiensis]MDN8599012.1 phage tail protein [Citrobacter enshiensis]